MALTCAIFIKSDIHPPLGHIAFHDPKNSGANGAFSPLFSSNHVGQATFMKNMRAGECVDIIITFMGQLFLNVHNFELAEADHTLFLFHFIFAQYKLEGAEIIEFECIMKEALLIFLIDQVNDECYGIVVFAIFFDLIFSIQFDDDRLSLLCDCELV